MIKKYVIGHRNPDTDSIAAAMSYAALKNKMGENVEAKRLGTLNEETKFATRFFKINAPELIDDARCTLKDIVIDEASEINEDDSCNYALNNILSNTYRTLFVSKNNELIGVVSISDLASLSLNTREWREKLLSLSKISIISKDIDGTILYESDTFDSTGKVRICEITSNKKDFKKGIVVADTFKELRQLVNEKPSLVIYSRAKKEVSKTITDLYRKNNISLISTQLESEEIIRIIYHAIPVSYIMSRAVVTYNINEFVNDVALKIAQTRFRCYPVVDDEGKVVGSLSRNHLYDYQKKKFILVDHSSKMQSIKNIDDGEVTEIIDHHHIGDIETKVPIYYRNQKMGSTCSIIYELYKENRIKPDKAIAGMMLSAILSDTLNFKSKTTTEKDIQYANELSKIAKVNIDDYASKLLNASVDLKNVDIKKLIERDLKLYNFSKYKVAIGQTNYDRIENVQKRMNEFKTALINYQENKELDLLIMMFTHVTGDGAMFLFYGPEAETIATIFETRIDEHTAFDSRIMSRKQQLVPMLDTEFNK